MKTLNVMLSNLGGRVVPIGYEGENLYTRIRINCIEVFADYPDATVSMVVNSPVGQMYPAVIEKSGVMVIWDITDAVLSSNGSGECQLTFTDGDVVRKSVVFGISINRSLIASGDPPEPVQEWIDKADQTAQEIAENAANLAKEDIVESYGSIAPAIIETASGAIASFSDGADGMLVKTLTVDIDPVQDLHGYDNPWPGGGGKNLFYLSSSYATQGTVTYSPNPATGELKLGGSAPSSQANRSLGEISVSVGEKYFISGTPTNGSTSTSCVRYVFRDTPSGTAIGSVVDVDSNGVVVTVPEGATILSIYSHTKENTDPNGIVLKPFVAKSEVALPFEPYENLCPISGWTSADVTRTGKSLITCTTAFSGTSRDITFSGNGNDINMTGTASGTNCDTPQMDIGSFEFKKNVTYIFSLIGAKTSNDVYARVKGDGDWIWLGSRTTYDNDRYKTVFSFDSDTYVNSMRVRFYTAQGTTATVNYKWQIEVAEASASFVPFVDSDTYTYPFPQSAGTVYGGTLTIRQDGTGTLIPNRTTHIFDGTENILLNATAGKFKMVNTFGWMRDVDGGQGISNMLKRGSSGDYTFALSDNLYFEWHECADATAMKAKLAGLYSAETPLVISYKVTTPVPVELTAQQVVSLLKGTNNLWSNTGNTAIEYAADTKLYIDGKIAELQALILENISNS